MLKTILLTLLSFGVFFASAQRVVTLDPDKDVIVRRTIDGSLECTVPVKALAFSIQETLPQITEIDSLFCKKIGKSNYLVVTGKVRENTAYSMSAAILLSEVSPGAFLADNIAVSCSSTGSCRECSLPPLCTCDKGNGNCNQTSAFMVVWKKVTVSLD